MVNNKYNIPVVLFVFRRLETVKMTFEILKEIKPSTLYVYADGARDGRDDEKEKVQAVRDFISNSVDWECDFIPTYRAENWGYARNIRDGFDTVLDKCFEAIFLEDDAVPTIKFFKFVELMLEKYKEDMRIEYVAGFNAIGKNDIIKNSYAFGLSTPMSGAIATWANRWKECDFTVRSWKDNKKNKKLKKYIFYNELYKFTTSNLDHVYEHQESEWDVQFGYDMYDKERFGIVPKVNLVRSYGNIDASHMASDSAGKMMASYMEPDDEIFQFPLDEPSEVVWNKEYDKRRQYIFLRVNGTYIERQKQYLIQSIKDIAYKILPRSIWKQIKTMAKKE